MPDPVTATATTTEGGTSEATPVSMIGEDGNFVKDWQKLLSDETLHEDKTLQTIKNVDGLAGIVVSTKRMVGADKISIPNENTTDEEMEAWHTAGGRPPTATDYNLTRPENFPEEQWSDELALSWMELFHKIGLNQKQVNTIFEKSNLDILTNLKAQNDEIITYQQESKDSLFRRWGAAYEPKKHQGNYAIEKGTGGDAEFKDRLLNIKLEGGGRLGDNPDFMEYSSNIGGKFAEHGDIVESHIATPGDIQAEIDKEMQTEAYQSRRHPGHKAMVKKVSLLFQEKNKVTPTGR